MLLFLSIVGLLSIVPLSVFAATGSAARTWEALREYLMVMGFFIVPPLVLLLITDFSNLLMLLQRWWS